MSEKSILHVKSLAKIILLFYAAGAVYFIIVTHLSFSIPCLFRLAAGFPCPGCGLTRAFVLAGRFDFIGAAKMNILFLPLSAVMTAFLGAALIDVFGNKNAIARAGSFFAKKWIVVLAAVLICASWWFNIVRGLRILSA